MASEEIEKNEQRIGEVHFYYEKAKFFRVIHVDGVHGGLTPRMNIHMAVFSERQPIPQRITHAVEADGSLGKEETDLRQQKEGFFREVEADIIFSVDTAKKVSEWLASRVAEAERMLSELKGEVK